MECSRPPNRAVRWRTRRSPRPRLPLAGECGPHKTMAREVGCSADEQQLSDADDPAEEGFEHGHMSAGELAQRGAGKEVDPQQFVPKVVRLAEIDERRRT